MKGFLNVNLKPDQHLIAKIESQIRIGIMMHFRFVTLKKREDIIKEIRICGGMAGTCVIRLIVGKETESILKDF
jgi:hypothetical protein